MTADDEDDHKDDEDKELGCEAPSARRQEPFKTDESYATHLTTPLHRFVTTRISIPAPVPTPVWFDAEVAKLLAISTPPSSPLSPWSSPLPQIPSPPLPPIPSPSLPVSPPLPVSSPVLVLSPSPPASPIQDRPEVTLPPQTRLGIALGPAYEVGESSSAAARPAGGLRADYGFVAIIDREIRRDPERDLLAGRLNMLFRDRHAHARTARLMETKARLSREAWYRIYRCEYLARTEITRAKSTHKALKLIKRLQTQMTEFERQQGPAKGPTQLELPEEAGSSS
ncbi:hypothetical protein Tco_0708618 [Tanacetum coccineum]